MSFPMGLHTSGRPLVETPAQANFLGCAFSVTTAEYSPSITISRDTNQAGLWLGFYVRVRISAPSRGGRLPSTNPYDKVAL